MDLDVRTITDGELDAWVHAMRTGFHAFAPEGEADRRRPFIDLSRTWGAFDGDRIVGTTRTFASEVTVPGGAAVAYDALTNVTVTATHRRRGLMTRMVEAHLRAARERGDVAAGLIAAEWPIYGRFGYGPATESLTFTVDRRAAQVVHEVAGRVDLVDGPTWRQHAPAVFDEHRFQSPGELRWRDVWWDEVAGVAPGPGGAGDQEFRLLSFDAAGTCDGYATYRVKEQWEGRVPQSTCTVTSLITSSVEALARLWQHLLQMDLVRTLVVEDRGPHDPMPWLVGDARAVRTTSRSDHVWLRLLDVPTALAARSYDRSAALVVEVADAQGLSGGRFALDASPEGATCAPTNAHPDVSLSMAALSSAYLGGTPLRLVTLTDPLDEHRPGAAATLDLLLRTAQAPWCSTWF